LALTGQAISSELDLLEARAQFDAPECPPVRVQRKAGLLPLPLSQRGGSLEQLACLLNVSSRNDFVLVVSWPWLRPSGDLGQQPANRRFGRPAPSTEPMSKPHCLGAACDNLECGLTD
jgi:hypothetical protein